MLDYDYILAMLRCRSMTDLIGPIQLTHVNGKTASRNTKEERESEYIYAIDSRISGAENNY